MTNSNQEIDKDALYGDFREQERKRLERANRLADRGAHKALDIAFEDDDTKIDVKKETTNHNGIGAKGLIGIAALMAIPSLGAGYMAWQALKKPATEVVEKVLPGKTTVIEKDKTVEVEVIPP